MELTFEERLLHLRHPFILSDSRIDTKAVVIVRLSKDGIAGIGESSPSKYFGESVQTVTAILDSLKADARTWNPWHRHDIFDGLSERLPASRSARNAIDMALWDWMGKALGKPVWQILGVDASKAPESSMTIGIDEPAVLKKKIEEARDFRVLKIKLGAGDRDFEIIETIRRITDRTIRVDANEGWERDEAARKIEFLSSKNVELVEQPLAKEDVDGFGWLKDRTPLPLFADESVMTSSDIPKLASACDGVNIKLDKSGGITEALAMISTAKSIGLKTMLGCMVQTSVGISAAAQISPLVSKADLDGHLLVADDPYHGIQIKGGKIKLDESAGIGLV